MNHEIIVIGFDGPNRVGKGTQGALLHDWLAEQGIPSLIVRGAGSRTGLGKQPGDPLSLWWQTINRTLHTTPDNYADWDRAAYRLARELLVWRDRVLPRLVKLRGQKLGVLLVDRSLISRTMTLRARQVEDIASNLYPAHARLKGRWIEPDLVCPDLIFNLTAPAEVLAARLSSTDPKYEFRKRLINETSDWFKDAVQHLPSHLRSRVVALDAARTQAAIWAELLTILQTRFRSLQALQFADNENISA